MPDEAKERQKRATVKPEAIRIGRNLISDDLEVTQRIPRGQWTSNLWHHTISAIQALAGSGMRLLRADGEGRLRVVDERILPSPYPVEVTNASEIGVQPPYAVYRRQDIGYIGVVLGYLLPPGEIAFISIVPAAGWMYKVNGLSMLVYPATSATTGYFDTYVGMYYWEVTPLRMRWNYNATAAINWNYYVGNPLIVWPPTEATWLDAMENMYFWDGVYLNLEIWNNTNVNISDNSYLWCAYTREKVSA